MAAKSSGSKSKVPLPGSERVSLPGSQVSGSADPNEQVRVTIIVRQHSKREEALAVNKIEKQALKERAYLNRKELESRYGADKEDLNKVEAFVRQNGLQVLEISPAKRSVEVCGTVAQLNNAFNVKLERYTYQGQDFRGREGPIYVPSDLVPVIVAVLGLDGRPQARSHMRIYKSENAKKGIRVASSGITYTPPQVAQLYDYPQGVDGSGITVAIIELGGGYSAQDLQNYFSGLNIPLPNVISVSVDGADNAPTGDPSGPDGEVLLDIEVIGSIAPKAKICVYFAPNTSAGFLDAINAAIQDTKNNPSAISISWGSAESTWTQQSLTAMDQAFQDASLLGITVCAASGDNGSSDGVTDGLAHVDFPASSEYILGCGGTRLVSSGGRVQSQQAWNDQPSDGATGGGVSDVFPLPSWQKNAGVPPSANPGGRIGRGVPDVAGDADPSTGYMVLVDGTQTPIGGTSAVAPLWTALVALLNQSLGKPVGFLNPLLYNGNVEESGGLSDVTSGSNGAYNAGPGWDACTGLGSPDGARLLATLK